MRFVPGTWRAIYLVVRLDIQLNFLAGKSADSVGSPNVSSLLIRAGVAMIQLRPVPQLT